MTTTHHAPVGITRTAVPSGPPVPTDPQGPIDAETFVTALEQELTAVGAALHDGVVQGLVAARLAIDIAERRGADPTHLAPVRSALAGALRDARETLWSLRSRGADGDVLAALGALAEHLHEHGGPGLTVHDAGVAMRVTPAASVLAYRLVQQVVAAVAQGSVSVDVSLRPSNDLRLVICAAGIDESPWPALRRVLDQVLVCGGSVLPVPAGLVVTFPGGEEPA